MTFAPAASPAGSSTSAKRIKSILVASDLSARGDRALARAAVLAKAHGAGLSVLHVVDDGVPSGSQAAVVAEAEAELRRALASTPAAAALNVAVEVRVGRDERDIIAAARDVDADLVVLGGHRNDGGRRPIFGATLERLIRRSDRPILVATERADAPYSRVLVGVDFSIYSRLALRAAFLVAPEAEIHIVHAYSPAFAGFLSGQESERDARAEHDQGIARLIDEELEVLLGASSLGGSPSTRPMTQVVRGEPCAVLISEVERLRPDLIVLGSHGRAGVAHLVLGSVAQDVLSRQLADALIVKVW